MFKLPSPSRTAIRGAALYALFGFLWILLSDKVLVLLVGDQETINRMQTYKGWFYIFITALLVFWLIRRYLGKFETSQRALRLSENRYRHLVDNAGDAFFLYSSQGKILDVNAVAGERLGYTREELLHMEVFDVSVHTTREMFRDVQNTPLDTPRTIVGAHRRKNGTTFPVEIVSCRFEEEGEELILALARDISTRLKTQELMMQSEKMRTIAGLAAGMAHEINNPLSVILQGVQVIQRRLLPDNPACRDAASAHGVDAEAALRWMTDLKIPKYLEGMQESAMRASDVIRTMLEFSHAGTSSKSNHDLSAIADEALELAGNDYDLLNTYGFGRIEVRTEYDASLDVVKCSRAEMVQVVLNLLSNAVQAMAEADVKRPSLLLRTFRREQWAVLEVRDNGPGMSEDVAAHLFEPFFTTKAPGVGTGLGLSVSFYIVAENHGGRLFVDSNPGQGATFRVELPL